MRIPDRFERGDRIGDAADGDLEDRRFRRRLRPIRIPEPTQDELDTLSVKERIELMDRRRQGGRQTLNSVGILFGVLFTAGSLIATAMTLRTAQEDRATDRFTRTVEQLGSDKRDVRVGAIYTMERIAADSDRDDPTIIALLTSLVREHDPAPGAEVPEEPATDVQAALAVLVRLDGARESRRLDLHRVRLPRAQVVEGDLSWANLRYADLTGADLTGANLANTDLHSAKLAGADLTGANLTGANLYKADLTGAILSDTNLTRAYLARATPTGAELINAVLVGAILNDSNLSRADLSGADLSGAVLFKTNLTGASLHDITGPSPEEIRKVARTNGDTLF
ncbi:pentapeptide repeat-containing protein [Actinomadura sp. HBU206391]|nr:pentapeptide repeat-containing protein [Actinomadura sp. HBU206391]